jgi:DNA invertase Pin-like site-specific DNA recombinase
VRLGLTVVATHTDAGVSGGKALEDRPALMAALDRLQRGDVLLVAKRDRLGRDVLHVAMISRLVERKGARIISASGEGTDDDSPGSKLMRGIIDVFSEYERAVIRSRTKAALQAKRARGEVVGHVPFGWQRDGKRLVRSPDELAVMQILWALRRDGQTLHACAEALHARGIRTRRGTAFTVQFCSQLLRRHLEAA